MTLKRRTMTGLAAAVAIAQPAQAQSWVSVPSDSAETQIAAAQWGDQTRVVARCDAGNLTAFVSRPAPLTGPVVFALTQRRPDEPSAGWWRLSQDGLNMVVRQPRPFLRDMIKGGVFDMVVKWRDGADWETTLALPAETDALMAVMESCGVEADDPPPAPPIRWRSPPRPTGADFPGRALVDNVSGAAMVNCVVTPQGVPGDCIVVDEMPLGYGFGQSAANIVLRGRLEFDADALALSDPVHFRVTVPFMVERKAVPVLPFATRLIQETKDIVPDAIIVGP